MLQLDSWQISVLSKLNRKVDSDEGGPWQGEEYQDSSKGEQERDDALRRPGRPLEREDCRAAGIDNPVNIIILRFIT